MQRVNHVFGIWDNGEVFFACKQNIRMHLSTWPPIFHFPLSRPVANTITFSWVKAVPLGTLSYAVNQVELTGLSDIMHSYSVKWLQLNNFISISDMAIYLLYSNCQLSFMASRSHSFKLVFTANFFLTSRQPVYYSDERVMDESPTLLCQRSSKKFSFQKKAAIFCLLQGLN